MEGVVTRLANKEQPMLGPVRSGGVPAMRACLTGVVGIHLHTQRAGQDCFVLQEGVQLGKSPVGGMPVGPALLLRRFLAVLPFRSFADMSQVFQTNDTMG